MSRIQKLAGELLKATQWLLAEWAVGVVEEDSLPTRVTIYLCPRSKDEIRKIARHFPHAQKGRGIVRWSVGEIVEIVALFSDSEFCERIVIGTKEVPEHVIPAHTEEIEEWRCDESWLSADNEEQAGGRLEGLER